MLKLYSQHRQLESQSGGEEDGAVGWAGVPCLGFVQPTEVQAFVRHLSRHHHRLRFLLPRRPLPVRRPREHSGARFLSLRGECVRRRHSFRQRRELEGECNDNEWRSRLPERSGPRAGTFARPGSLAGLQLDHVSLLQRPDASATRLRWHLGDVHNVQ